MNKPSTYTAQYVGKWHAGFTIGNQSFVLSVSEGTEEEAKWYAEMLDKAFSKLEVVEEVEWGCDDHGRQACSSCLRTSKEIVLNGKPPLPLQWTLKSNGLPFCPLCGNKTKR